MTWQDPGGNPAPGDGGATGPFGGDPPPAAPPPPVSSYPPGGTYTPPPAGSYGGPGYLPPGIGWAPPSGGPVAYDPTALRFADVVPRFVAWLVDVLLLGLVNALIGVALSAAIIGSIDWQVAFGSLSGTFGDAGQLGRIIALAIAAAVVGMAIDAAYFILQWSGGTRGTLGMRLLNIEVGNAADGRTLSRPQAVRRWIAMGSWLSLLGVIPGVGLIRLLWSVVLLISTATSQTRQGVHDQFARTVVVQRGASDNALIVGCFAVLAILALFLVIPLVALIFLGGQVSTILSQVGDSI